MKYFDVLKLKSISHDEDELSICHFFLRFGGFGIISIISLILKEEKRIPSFTICLSGYLFGVILYDVLKNITPVFLIEKNNKN